MNLDVPKTLSKVREPRKIPESPKKRSSCFFVFDNLLN